MPFPASTFLQDHGIRTPYAPATPIERMPAFAFTGNGAFDMLSYSVITNDPVPRLLETTSYPMNESLTWQKGRQLIKMGVQLRAIALNASSDQFPAGLLTFNGNNNVRFSGYSVADLLLGIPFSSRFALLPPPSQYRTMQKAAFVQVDRQVGERLTLNLGVRWEQRPPVTEASDVIASFDPSLGKVVVASPGGEISKAAYPNLVNQYKDLIVTATQAGWHERRLANTDNNNWAPRVGFAFRVDRSGRTVIRSGYGMFYSYYPFQQAVLMSQIVPFALISQTQSPAADPMTTTNPFRVVSGALTFKGFEKDFRDGYNQQWNFAIEHVLGKDNLLNLTYVGNKGVHLPWDTPTTATGFNNLRIVRSRGNSNYNALQAEIRRRYGKGFFYQLNWTWAKSLDDHMVGVNTEMQLYSTSLRLNRGDSPFVRRHTLRGNFLYRLPLGRRQRFGGGWNPMLDGILGGWSLGGITSFSTGGFLTPVVQGGLYSSRPDRVLGVPIRLTDADRKRLAAETGDAIWLDRTKRWFNPGAFSVVDADAERFGNAGRNIIVGPRTFGVDGVLSKSFSLHEAARLTVRVESFNVTNRVNFAMGAAGNTPLNVAINSPNVGSFSRTNGNPRQFQFALRLDF